MLVYASRGCELVPGDVIGSGTCGAAAWASSGAARQASIRRRWPPATR